MNWKSNIPDMAICDGDRETITPMDDTITMDDNTRREPVAI